MTNTLNKIIHNGDEYEFPEWFAPESAWTTWQFLQKTANWYDWTNSSGGGDVIISPDSWNVLTVWAWLWVGDKTDLPAQPDSNTLYFGY